MDDLASAPTALDLYRAPRNHFLSFGCATLDAALRGVPRNSITELCGVAGSGKTQLALQLLLRAQLPESVGGLGGKAFFLSCGEGPFPSQRLRQLAQALVARADVPYSEQQLLERVYVETVDTFERMRVVLRDALPELLRQGDVRLVVIDSVAALVPEAEIKGEMGDSHVGLQARLMSQALRKLTGGLNTTKTTAIFINQLREKIGVFFGSPETTAGGKALKFYASVRLDIRRIETLKDGAEAVGNRTRVKVVKNKMAPPFKQAEFDIIYGVGISREGSLIDFGVEHGIVKKSGAWYTYDGEQLGQGKENARSFLIKNPDVAAEIESKIKTKLGIGVAPAAAPTTDELAARRPA